MIDSGIRTTPVASIFLGDLMWQWIAGGEKV